MMTFPFKPLELGDRARIERYTIPSSLTNCDLAFANMYCWQPTFRSEWTEVDGFLVIRFRIDGGARVAYMQPVGEGDFTAILPQLAADAAAHGQPLRLIGLTNEAADRLRRLAAPASAAAPASEPVPVAALAAASATSAAPATTAASVTAPATAPAPATPAAPATAAATISDRFGAPILAADRDLADYLYLREDLCRLSGRHYQPKRNHINRFLAAYPDYRYEPLTPDRFEECMRLEQAWYRLHEGIDGEEEIVAERQAIRRAFGAFEELGLRGGCLYVGERMVAFTYGSAVNHETFDIHVEKADTTYEGAFTMINRLFAETLPEQYRCINREEDLGLEGLRRAKLSYAPIRLADKLRALFPEEEELACKRLWLSCFPEDDEAFADRFLLSHYVRGRMLVRRSEGRIAAMLHRIPFTSPYGRLGYLYGVATDPACRGRGYASELVREAIRRAREAGERALFLIAADDSLRGFYARFGFEGSVPLLFRTADGFDFGTGDPSADRAMILRLDPAMPMPEQLCCREAAD